MKKILVNVFTLGVVAAVAISASQAFFSDIERSTGNFFEAGSIDLKIDNKSYTNSGPEGGMKLNPSTSWELSDLADQVFFDFQDLKPGDLGEDTVSIHIDSNPAWACVSIDLTHDDDNSTTDSELDDGDVEENQSDIYDGELASQLNFIFWADDGDNVLEDNEPILTQGPVIEIWGGVTWSLADSQGGVFGSEPLNPNTDYYIGKAWCFGEITPAALSHQDNGGPVERGPGVNCDGSQVNNLAQTDYIRGNITFYAEQARHNESFTCDQALSHQLLILENKNEDNWFILSDETSGTLTWKGDGPTFDFSNSLVAQNLKPNTDYSLIYYADPWPGNHPGALLGEGTSDANGNLIITGNPDLGMDLPHSADANYSEGAKIWLVLSNDYNSTLKKMTKWHPDDYLFEYNLIKYNDTEI